MSTFARVVVALLLVAVGAALARASTPTVVVTVRDTLAPAEYARAIRDVRIERDGLRARLEGVQALTPETITHVDTVVTPPDTVYEFVTIRRGVVSAGVLVLDSMGLATPELHRTRFTNCDDGLEVSAGGVICDPARFGHLYIGPGLTNRSASLGAWWTPSDASPWEFGAGLVQAFGGEIGWYVGVRRGWRLF